MERTNANEPLLPSDPGPDDVSDEPPYGSLQFTVLEILNALLDLDSNKGPGPDGILPENFCFGVCIAKVGSAMMCRTIVVLQYYRRLVNFLNYWFTDTCTRT
jgi:hypothetical protein